jgi:sulfite exporter TauE/SafE
VDVALILGAGLLGLVGTPHCSAMCSAPCSAVVGRCGGASPHIALAGFMTGRLLAYAAGGAAVAAGVLAFSTLGQLAPVLRPVWTATHAAALGLGLWLLFSARLPAWWRGGARTSAVVAPRLPAGWQRVAAPARAAGAGALWLVLPCGLLQSALLVAALANTPLQGAAAMAAFAATSSLGLGALPVLWARGMSNARASAWAARLAGGALVATSAWALGDGLWQRVAALCVTA